MILRIVRVQYTRYSYIVKTNQMNIKFAIIGIILKFIFLNNQNLFFTDSYQMQSFVWI